jgi:acyl-CoA synthetase (AMP-forming)/AMP-acid ligase II
MGGAMTVLETTVDLAKRRALANSDEIGAGNFLDHALALSPNSDAAILFLEQPYRSPAAIASRKRKTRQTSLSLNQLKAERDFYASWYHRSGVKPKDPVAVYLDDGIEYLVHYLALTALGAIPVLTNGNLAPEIAALYFRKVGVVGLFVDESHKAALEPYLSTTDAYRFVAVDQDVVHDARRPSDLLLPKSYPFVHQDLDPIMIAHSSGTTGIPKAVLLQHRGFFHGVRYRLSVPSTGGPERILSALPHSHNCAMAYIMLALLCASAALRQSRLHHVEPQRGEPRREDQGVQADHGRCLSADLCRVHRSQRSARRHRIRSLLVQRR